MQKLEDILTGLMTIGSAIITMAIVAIGAYFVFSRNNFISLTLIFGLAFLALYTLRNIYIGLGIIVHGRYQDEMTMRDKRMH